MEKAKLINKKKKYIIKNSYDPTTLILISVESLLRVVSIKHNNLKVIFC
jgi:hypothetical protein